MNLEFEMNKIKNHFDNIDTEDFEKKLIEHGVDEIKSLDNLGVSLYMQDIVLPTKGKRYSTKNIYDDMSPANFTFKVSGSSFIGVAWVGNQDTVKSSLIFQDYVVNYVEFELNKEFKEEPISINFNITKSIAFNEKKPGIAYVTIETVVFENAEENNYPFSLNVSIEGKFEVQEASEEEKEYLVNNNAVAILFPYVRALISTYTANANVPPLILPPVNILKMID